MANSATFTPMFCRALLKVWMDARASGAIGLPKKKPLVPKFVSKVGTDCKGLPRKRL